MPPASSTKSQERRHKLQIQRLRDSVVKLPPYCQGTLPISKEDFTLFYGAVGDAAHRLDLSEATHEQLQTLSGFCQPASFGVDQKDVYDESYRKAGKLDKTDFATNLNVDRVGLVDAIHRDLIVDRRKHDTAIRAEIYKLNVYGTTSFFKAHVDTPRSELQFGSLVIVFPTPHEGGALVLRERGQNDEVTREWTFDSASLLAKCGEPSIAYVAFFSDVEHEVMPVLSGHRVTITYNLFWALPDAPVTHPVPHSISTNQDTFKSTLQELLADTTFLPEGGNLLFCLAHKYPLESQKNKTEGCQSLQDLTTRLKASDAMLFRVFTELSLAPSLKIIYEVSEHPSWFSIGGPHVMCDRVLPLDKAELVNAEPLGSTLVLQYGAELLAKEKPYWAADMKMYVPEWVVDGPATNRSKTSFMAYGNEASLEVVYWQIWLFVPIGPAGNRTGTALPPATAHPPVTVAGSKKRTNTGSKTRTKRRKVT